MTRAELVGRLYALQLRAEGQARHLAEATRAAALDGAIGDAVLADLIERTRQQERDLEALRRDLEVKPS